MAGGGHCLWKHFFCPQTKVCSQGPQGSKQAEEATSPAFASPFAASRPRFSLPRPQHLSPSGWSRSHSLACFFSMWRLYRLLFLPCFPSPVPPFLSSKCLSHPSLLSHAHRLSSGLLKSPHPLPVLDVDNLARVAFLTANLITWLPLLENPRRTPCCPQSQVLMAELGIQGSSLPSSTISHPLKS